MKILAVLHEAWKPIPGFSGYEVSSLGRVRTYWHRVVGGARGEYAVGSTPKLMRTQVQATGYQRVCIGQGDARKQMNVHRLVAIAFLPKPDGKDWVLHGDGDPTNNHVNNLRWGTPSENQQDAVAHCSHDPHRGTAQRHAKLSADVVREIRETRGRISCRAWAERIGCSRQAVQNARAGKKWAWV